MHVFTKNLQSILGPERFTDCLVEIDAVDFDKKNSEKQCEMRRKTMLEHLEDTDYIWPAARITEGLALVCRGVCCRMFLKFDFVLSVPAFASYSLRMDSAHHRLCILFPTRLGQHRTGRRRVSNFAVFVG